MRTATYLLSVVCLHQPSMYAWEDLRRIVMTLPWKQLPWKLGKQSCLVKNHHRNRCTHALGAQYSFTV